MTEVTQDILRELLRNHPHRPGYYPVRDASGRIPVFTVVEDPELYPAGHPEYATALSAGVDLRARETAILRSGDTVLVPTGIRLALPPGYEGQVRPRSGLALKAGITVLNAPGTIDADYRGEIGVILHNASRVTVNVHRGDRIAQLVIAAYEQIQFCLTDNLDDTTRGAGGYGSTGVA